MSILFPYKGPKPEVLTAERTMEYADENIERFSDMIKAAEEGNNSIRPGECTEYLFCWQSIQEKRGEWDKLSLTERNEVIAEYYDQDHDHDAEDEQSSEQD